MSDYKLQVQLSEEVKEKERILMPKTPFVVEILNNFFIVIKIYGYLAYNLISINTGESFSGSHSKEEIEECLNNNQWKLMKSKIIIEEGK